MSDSDACAARQALLSAGADHAARTADGDAAGDVARRKGYAEHLRLLRRYGADTPD